MCSVSEAPHSNVLPQLHVRPSPEELEDPQLRVDSGLEDPAGGVCCGSSHVSCQLHDVHAIAEDDRKIANMHANAEKFDPRAEGNSVHHGQHILVGIVLVVIGDVCSSTQKLTEAL